VSTDELLAEALRLTRVDRARVAEELLSSLEESDEEVAAAWAAELERRSREIANGRVQTISWEPRGPRSRTSSNSEVRLDQPP
jgi:putative addiction module component (TIGR02574 family)